MKNDIDFDELDRAVNSLMGGAAATSEDETPKAKTLTISTTLKPGEGPSYTKLDEVAKKIGSETLTTDDDPTQVKDLGEISHSETQPILVNGSTPPESPKSDPLPTGQIPGAARPTSGRFMDVVHPSSDMKSPTPSTSQSTSVKQSEPAVVVSAPKPVSAPAVEVTSPFITDAKVEKRPLGDPFADPAPQGKGTTQSVAEKNDAPEEIVAINSEALAREESSKDTQAILDATKIETSTDAIDQQLQAIESIHAEPVAASSDASLRAVESVDTALQPVTAQNDQPQGAIYDVKEYHQPLNHPAKQKSGWGVVIIIVVIIVLAAAAGAGAFFLLGLGN